MKKVKLFILLCVGFVFSLYMKVSADTVYYDSSKKYFYVVDVEDVPTQEAIAQTVNLKAYDDGTKKDVSSAIESVVNIDYKNNVLDAESIKKRKLGEYKLRYKVQDEFENGAECEITAVVKDLKPPVVDMDASTLEYTVEVSTLTNDIFTTIKSGIVASDVYSDTVTISTIENNVDKYKKLGTYDLVYEVKDPSDNKASVNVKLKVEDTTPPVISYSTKVFVHEYNDDYKEGHITNFGLSALDAVDGNIDLVLVKDDFDGNEGKVGTYEIVYSATDKSGNSSKITLQMKVIDNVAPRFTLDDVFVEITTNTKYTFDDFKALAIDKKGNSDFEMEVLEDNYSDNYNVEGSYKYRVKLSSKSGEEEMVFNIDVIKEKIKKQKEGFFKTLLKIILYILNVIWKIIKWPFTLF